MKCYYFEFALPLGQTLWRVTRIQRVLNFNHVGGKTDTLALCFRPHNIMFSFSFFGSLHLTEFFYFLFFKCYYFEFALPLGQTRLRVTRMQTVLNFFPLVFSRNNAAHDAARFRCDGRVVKALDLKSNGVSPHRFEPCSQRFLTVGNFFAFGFAIDTSSPWTEIV